MQSFSDQETNKPQEMHSVIDMLSRFSEGRVMPKELVRATDDQMFWLHDGPGLRTLRDLKDALDNVTQDQFDFHMGEGKNDFANWVHYVLKDDACADALWKCKTVLSTRRVLIKFLKEYA